ncbi:hypothetical protein [Enterococcus mundtii]|uniref:hypothetical protein n=1 Tax=Enterococcus mundtii TaxID=53346 RepID=UPI0007EEE34B|nr:hypothetical protein [Enterococcus mundtii]OBS60877.1 hypothetical protein AX758_06905 [Enterococcus mundtii]
MMDILENILTVTGVIGLFYGIGSWLYYHKIGFYLFLNKIMSSKREVQFDLTTSFKKQDSIDFKKIEDFLKNQGYTLRKQQNLKNSKIYNLGNFLFEVKQIDLFDEDDHNVTIGVINAAITYKSALKVISDYKKITEHIFEIADINSRQSQSSLTLKYGDSNPFMGRNLASFDKKSIKNFSCQVSFSEIIGSDDPTIDGTDIFIYKESINYTTNNLDNLVNVARICFNTYR